MVATWSLYGRFLPGFAVAVYVDGIRYDDIYLDRPLRPGPFGP